MFSLVAVGEQPCIGRRCDTILSIEVRLDPNSLGRYGGVDCGRWEAVYSLALAGW